MEISEKNLGNYLPSEARFYNLLEVHRDENKRGPNDVSRKNIKNPSKSLGNLGNLGNLLSLDVI